MIISFKKDNDIISTMTKLNKCYSCQLFNMKATNDILLEIIINKVFNIDIDVDKEINPMVKLNEFHTPDILEDFKKLKKKKK